MGGKGIVWVGALRFKRQLPANIILTPFAETCLTQFKMATLVIVQGNLC